MEKNKDVSVIKLFPKMCSFNLVCKKPNHTEDHIYFMLVQRWVLAGGSTEPAHPVLDKQYNYFHNMCLHLPDV